MRPDWKMIREMVEQALDLAPRDRTVFLDEACADDPELRREVDEMLALREHPGAAVTEILPAGPLRVGEVVDGKYRIDGVLGTGGMGAVYRATHLQLERAVALKAIRSELVAHPSMAERFRREAVAVARLRHPHIVTVHDYGVATDAGAYLVMELLEGHSLRAELADRTWLDVPAALDVMAQVCTAVGAAHRAGVIHRDLKPENIFLEHRDGGVTVKVVDFGLAKLEAVLQSGSVGPTQGGTPLGTPAYMSPEQCRGEGADARSDVYALGCVMYEILTGKRPFTGKTVWALVYQHVNDEPPRPSALVSGLAPRVDEAVLRALAKDPADRHRSPEAFAEALGASTEGAVAEQRQTNNLPHTVTHFVGREREIDEVLGWLARARLVTLVGPGGIGKTRLALETAARVLDEYEDGVWLVELAALSDPNLVPRAVGSALGVHDQGGLTETESIEAWLRDKRLLLVLDNCEHLVGACAELTVKLLGASAGLRVLATSQESLGVAGEAVWPVPTLTVPAQGEGDGSDCEAAQLFADRASLARPGFEATQAVAELCRRLEGIPLAIELAAARVKALTVEQILERLDDRFRLLAGGSRTAPTRQQTLRATLDWSYDLLTDAERALLRRLAIFSGGWTLEAAQAVCEEPDVLDLLARLVDKSVLFMNDNEGPTRYGMLETVREYASGLLSASGEAEAIRRRHAEYFQAKAEESKLAIWEGRSGQWLDGLEKEHDNVRAAFGWLLENDADRCLALATAVNSFRELRGHLRESRRSLESALARSHTASALLRANALISVGNVASMQGDLTAARGFLEQCLPLAKESGNTRQMASVAFQLGVVASLEGDARVSRAYLEESLAISRQGGYANFVSLSLNALGEVVRLEGDSSAARAYYEQAIAVSRKEKHDHFLIVPLCNLGAVACEGDDVDVARACYEEALVAAQALNSMVFVSLALDGLAAVAAKRGAWERAGRLAGAAEALLEAIGATLAPNDRAFRERCLADVREHLDEAEFEAALAKGRATPSDRAIDDALAS